MIPLRGRAQTVALAGRMAVGLLRRRVLRDGYAGVAVSGALVVQVMVRKTNRLGILVLWRVQVVGLGRRVLLARKVFHKRPVVREDQRRHGEQGAQVEKSVLHRAAMVEHSLGAPTAARWISP